MHCTSCGSENPSYVQFCFSCGRAVSPIPLSLQPSPSVTPQYSNFVLQLVAGLFMFAASVVDLLQLQMLNEDGSKLIRPLLMFGAALWFFVLTRRSWKTSFVSLTSDYTLKKRNRRVLRTATILAILFLSCASLLGWLIGKSRLQLITLNADLNEYTKLGDDVSRARNNAGNTIESFVAMYEAIEQNTNALQQTTTRLLGELTQYDVDFPEYRAQTQKSLHNVTITQRRTFLLQKQIAVAKEVKLTASAEQGELWREKMLPLLHDEEKLDSQ